MLASFGDRILHQPSEETATAPLQNDTDPSDSKRRDADAVGAEVEACDVRPRDTMTLPIE